MRYIFGSRWEVGWVGGWINVLIRVTSALFEVEIDVAFRPGLATFNQIIQMKEKVKYQPSGEGGAR